MFSEIEKFPELSKAVQYFKETERGFGKMCKTVEDYAKEREKSLKLYKSKRFFDG